MALISLPLTVTSLKATSWAVERSTAARGLRYGLPAILAVAGMTESKRSGPLDPTPSAARFTLDYTRLTTNFGDRR